MVFFGIREKPNANHDSGMHRRRLVRSMRRRQRLRWLSSLRIKLYPFIQQFRVSRYTEPRRSTTSLVSTVERVLFAISLSFMWELPHRQYPQSGVDRCCKFNGYTSSLFFQGWSLR